jgi:hypothetical protein
MTWLDDLEYGSDASDASWDDSVVESSVWRGATSPLDSGDWLRELEESLRDDISKDGCYGGVGTNEEGAFGTNEKEGDERLYMGLKKEWYCQRCGTVVKKTTPSAKEFPQDCATCKRNAYLCDKNVGVVVEQNANKKRGGSNSYSMARIFHTESMGTPFRIDTNAGSMEVTIPQVPGAPTFPHGTVVYKLAPSSIKALTTQLGRGLVGTVAENVDRSRPEVVVVQPAGGGEVKTIVNPQFGVLYTDDTVTPVSQNLPTVVDPSGGDPPPPSGRTKRSRDVPVEVDTVEDLFADALAADDVAPPEPPPPPSGGKKRPRDEVDTVEDLFADALAADDDVAPPASRQRQSIDVHVYFDYDMEAPPVLIQDVETVNMLILKLQMDYSRFGDDDNDVIQDTESYEYLTQNIMNDAIASGASLLKVLVYSKDAVDLGRDENPSTTLRNVEGMMLGGNPLMMTNGLFANDEEEDDGERDRLVDDDEEDDGERDRLVDDDEEDDGERDRLVDDEEEDEEDEEDEEEDEDEWGGRTALDADRDDRMNTAFMVQGHGNMTLAQYLEENPELVPWADFISPHRLSMLDNVTNPFLVLSPMFFEGAVSEAQRFLNMHNNAQHLSGLGLGVTSFDKRFLNGIQWDVNMISNAKKAKEERTRKEAEKRAIKERKAAEQEADRQRRKREKEEAGMMRASAKKAEMERRIAAAEDNRRLKAELKEEEIRRKQENKEMRKQDRTAMRDLDKLMKPGLKGLETDEERAVKRRDAAGRYGKLPWAQPEPPGGVAHHPETGHPIVFTDVPEIVRNALFWLMAYRLYLHMNDPLSNEMIFRNINRYYGRAVGAGGQRDLSKRQWRSWQLQRKIPGTSGFLGQYIESILAALVNAASIVDPRIDSSDSALSWIVWILNPTNAERWLRDPVVVQGLQEQEYHPVGRASSSRTQDKYDAEFRDRNPNWFPPLPTTLEIPDLPIVPPAPPPPLPADPTLPMPPPRPPPAPPSDVGSSAAGSSAAGSSAAGSSTDPLPLPEPAAPPNMDNVTQLVELHHAAHPDDMSWGLQDALNLLNETGGMERAADIIVPETGAGDAAERIRLNVQMTGATPTTARFLRDSGVTTAQIVATGLFDVSNLVDEFSVDSLVAAGILPLDLLHAGGSVTDLRRHLSREILRDQGFSDGDM